MNPKVQLGLATTKVPTRLAMQLEKERGVNAHKVEPSIVHQGPFYGRSRRDAGAKFDRSAAEAVF